MVTATLCMSLPVQRHVTVVPFLTVTVKQGTKVTWRWTGKDMHNVAVTKGPVKFHSSYKTSGTFSRKLTRTGTYTVVCSIHQPDMRMKLRVTR